MCILDLLDAATWQDMGYSTEQELCTNSLDWVEDSTQSVWDVCIKFDTCKNIENCTVLKEKMLRENHVYIESNSLELTVKLYRCYKYETLISYNTTVYLLQYGVLNLSTGDK